MVGRVGSLASGRCLSRGRPALLLLALAAGCAEAPTGTAGKNVAAAAGESAALRRLLPGPTSAGIAWTIDSAWHRAPLATSEPERAIAPMRESRFEADGAPSGWLVDARFGALVDPEAAGRDVAPATVRDGALALPERASVAALVVPASPITPYVLTFRVRGAATGNETRLFIHEFTRDWSEQRDPALLLAGTRAEGEVEEVLEVAVVATAEKGDPRGLRLVRPRCSAPDGDGWSTWRVEWSSRWRTRSLALSFCGSRDGASAIDDVRLVELPARALLGLPAGAPENFDLPRPWESLDAARRITKVRSEWEARRALLLPRGGKASATFANANESAGGAGGRVELGLAIVREERLCARGPCRATVRVTWNGGVRDHPLELHFDTPTGWQEVALPLPEGGGACTLALEVVADAAGGAADDGALIAVSDPLLFATDPAAAPADSAPWNVVVLSLDTLRADRLGKQRGGKSLTPRLDALAAESIRFTHALANASYTLPSHVSLFTSQRPGDHGVLTVFDVFDAARSASLARLLAARGFATAAFTSGAMLSSDFCGIDVGFDRWGEIDTLLTEDDRLRETAPLQQRAGWNRELARRRRLDADLLPWLRSHRGAPFLLFLHSYLTHNYQPEPALRAEFTRGLPATPLALHGAAPYRAQLCTTYLAKEGKGDRRFSFTGDGEAQFVAGRDLPWFEALYDATVAQADREVGRLLDALEQNGLAQRTIVVVTSDHGEEFLEHGDLSHARTLFDEILRVPLLIRVPGMAPRVVAEPVELIDVAPTLLARLGIAPDPRMRGSDLLDRGFEARRITIHEGAGGVDASRTRRAARMRDGKLIVVAPLAARGDAALSAAVRAQLEAGGYMLGHDGLALPEELAAEYYDLAHDPREQRDLALDEARPKPQSLRMAELAQELGAAPFGRTEGE